MSDVEVSVGITGDTSQYEAAVNKARGLGRQWTSETAASTARASAGMRDVAQSVGGVKTAFSGVTQLMRGDVVGAFNSFVVAGRKAGALVAGALTNPVAAAVVGLAAIFTGIAKLWEGHVAAVGDQIDASVKKWKAGIDDARKGLGIRPRTVADELTGTPSEKLEQLRRMEGDAILAADRANEDYIKMSAFVRERLQSARGEPAKNELLKAQEEFAVRGGAAGTRAKEVTAARMAAESAMSQQRSDEAEQTADADRRAGAQAENAAALDRAQTEFRRTQHLLAAPNDDARRRMQLQFMGQDYRTERQRYKAASTLGPDYSDQATAALKRMETLLNDANAIQREIRKNTAKGTTQ